ncbi:MAG: cAMP-binding protein [Magnetovibrio sp.]|nr:cAMP-binding protein [Magnetovibrio sp.]
MGKPVLDRRIFESGRTIFEEGDEENCAYIVESGEVEISKTINGKREILSILNENCLFGELALIDSKPRMASAKAKTTVSIIRVNKLTFQKNLKRLTVFYAA